MLDGYMSARSLLLVAIGSICTYTTATAEQKDQVNYVPEFSCSRGPHSLRLPKSYDQLRSIGKLKSQKVIATQDWDKYKTQERELLFDGLRLTVITFTNDKARYVISGAEITDRRWSIAGSFKIGDTIEEALKSLNARRNPKANQIKVGGDTDSVVFRVVDGRVVAIAYDCYTG